MAKIVNLLLILPFLLLVACSRIDPREIPEGIAYVYILSKDQQDLVDKVGRSACWLEFMLVNASGKAVASKGKATVKVFPKDSHSKSYQKEFNVTEKDYYEKPFSQFGAMKANPKCCLIGPFPPGKVIEFEFQRPDGVIFRRKITPPVK
jgi:hypothetical protein